MSAKTTAYDSQASSRLARFAATGLTALAILGAMGAGIAFLQHRANAQPMPERNPPVTVATEPVSIVDAYEVEERFTGRLEPARRTRIAFERSGLVTAVLHDEGEFVTTGTLLARLDTAELETGRRLLQAQRRELAAQLGLAEAELVRNKALETKGWASRQRYDESRYRVARLRAGIERVNAQLEANRIDLDISTNRSCGRLSREPSRRAAWTKGRLPLPAPPSWSCSKTPAPAYASAYRWRSRTLSRSVRTIRCVPTGRP
jgi:multidrug efflux pump subunit AcrA (membrane-fusion protein)